MIVQSVIRCSYDEHSNIFWGEVTSPDGLTLSDLGLKLSQNVLKRFINRCAKNGGANRSFSNVSEKHRGQEVVMSLFFLDGFYLTLAGCLKKMYHNILAYYKRQNKTPCYSENVWHPNRYTNPAVLVPMGRMMPAVSYICNPYFGRHILITLACVSKLFSKGLRCFSWFYTSFVCWIQKKLSISFD